MLDKLKGVEERFLTVEQKLSDPAVVKDQKEYQKYAREHSDLSKVVTAYRSYQKLVKEINESAELLKDSDPEIKELAKEEYERLIEEKEDLEKDLRLLLMPKDPNDDKNIFLEIRSGTGGEEAALFAYELFRMYSRFAERRNWKVEVVSSHETGVGGLKEIIVMIQGKGAYSQFKFESGIHRVQRVPETEAQGRIHTSAVTVAVLPEAEEVDVQIDPTELKLDYYRASGPGGQHVNKTDSAVRITHLPTGLVVTCQDEKSQLKNRGKAMKVLRARLLDHAISEQNEKISEERKSQVGSGDRSGRIRTYNFPQGRVTDHRIGVTLYKLESILQGEIDELVDGLTTYFQAQALENANISQRKA